MNSKNIDMEEKAMVEKIKELITKSELKSNKVDLSLADDLKKASVQYKELVSLMQENIEKAKKIEMLVAETKQFITKGDNLFDSVIEIQQKFRDATKLLGIDPLENNDYKILNDNKSLYKTKLQELNKIFFKYNK
jgi:hypothetical protein